MLSTAIDLLPCATRCSDKHRAARHQPTEPLLTR
jgi:hypothetical protein